MARKTGLVVVRCGDNSLHPGWLGENRTWDLAVSYFGSDAEREFSGADYVHRFKGGKWDGLFDFFRQNPQTLDAYDYFWLPDDDIAATPETVEKLFQTIAENKFELAQPGLSHGSYSSHLVVLSNPAFQYRLVNFVELMVPVLSRSLLREVLPLFAQTRSGFGVDFVWQRFVSDPLTKVAIIDEAAVTHTRPAGGALHTMISKEGHVSAREEQDIFLAPYGDKVRGGDFIEATLGGKLKTGQIVTQRPLAATVAALGWLSKPFGNCGFTKELSLVSFLAWNYRQWYNSLARPLQLSPLAPIYQAPANAQAGVLNENPGAVR